jgi:hypothetical protein
MPIMVCHFQGQIEDCCCSIQKLPPERHHSTSVIVMPTYLAMPMPASDESEILILVLYQGKNEECLRALMNRGKVLIFQIIIKKLGRIFMRNIRW